jgi:hypothetical protein
MDIGKAFTFVFEDKEWVTKMLIAAAIMLLGTLFSWLLFIPLIVAFALLGGYSVEIIRQVLRGELDGLPEWDNWGALLADGLKVIIIAIVYALPIIVIAICLSIPIGVFSQDAEAVSSLIGAFMACLILLYTIAISIVLPAAIAFYAAEDDMAAAFRFGDVFGLVRDNLATYLVTFLMSWVANFVGNLGSVVCGVLWALTYPYGLMVVGHLYGQAYVEATAQGLAPVPAPEEPVEPEEEIV